MNAHQKKWQDVLQVNRDVASQSPPLLVSGRLTKVNGLVMEAVGLRMAVGSTCVIQLPNNNVEAEVVGFSGEKLFLMPEIDVQGLLPGARVIPFESARNKAVPGQYRRSADLVPVDRLISMAHCRKVPVPHCKAALSIRLTAHPSRRFLTLALGPLMRCLPSVAASVWVCSPVAVLEKVCFWA